MSRSSMTDESYRYDYGHDHACGYFVQVYDKNNFQLICEIDETFGLVFGNEEGRPVYARHSHKGEKAVAACQSFFDKMRRKEIPVELMIRDPKTHLGAAIAKKLRENGIV